MRNETQQERNLTNHEMEREATNQETDKSGLGWSTKYADRSSRCAFKVYWISRQASVTGILTQSAEGTASKQPRNEYRYSREVEAAARDQAVRKQVPIAPITPGTDTDRVEGCSRVPGGVQATRGPLDCQQELREPSLHATRECCVDRQSEDLEGHCFASILENLE